MQQRTEGTMQRNVICPFYPPSQKRVLQGDVFYVIKEVVFLESEMSKLLLGQSKINGQQVLYDLKISVKLTMHLSI